MGSLWNHTFPDMKNYFRSLSALSGSFNFGLKVDIQVVCLHVDVYFGLLYLITLSSPTTPYCIAEFSQTVSLVPCKMVGRIFFYLR